MSDNCDNKYCPQKPEFVKESLQKGTIRARRHIKRRIEILALLMVECNPAIQGDQFKAFIANIQSYCYHNIDAILAKWTGIEISSTFKKRFNQRIKDHEEKYQQPMSRDYFQTRSFEYFDQSAWKWIKCIFIECIEYFREHTVNNQQHFVFGRKLLNTTVRFPRSRLKPILPGKVLVFSKDVREVLDRLFGYQLQAETLYETEKNKRKASSKGKKTHVKAKVFRELVIEAVQSLNASSNQPNPCNPSNTCNITPNDNNSPQPYTNNSNNSNNNECVNIEYKQDCVCDTSSQQSEYSTNTGNHSLSSSISPQEYQFNSFRFPSQYTANNNASIQQPLIHYDQYNYNVPNGIIDNYNNLPPMQFQSFQPYPPYPPYPINFHQQFDQSQYYANNYDYDYLPQQYYTDVNNMVPQQPQTNDNDVQTISDFPNEYQQPPLRSEFI